MKAMKNTRKFHLANLLCVSTGFLFQEPGTDYPIDAVYNILDYMTGDSLQTVALGRAADECKPYLLEQHPFLKEISVEDMRGNKDLQAWKNRLAELVAKYGEFHEVRPMHFEDHEFLDPMEDIRRIRGNTDNVIVIEQPSEEINPAGNINWKSDSEE